MSNEAQTALVFAVPSVVLALATVGLALTKFRARPGETTNEPDAE